MKDKKIGSVSLSLDCEGKWGMADQPPAEWNQYLTNSNLISTYQYILKVLENYKINAIFGFVGAFTETKHHFSKFYLPKFVGRNHSFWIDKVMQRLELENEGWFVPELLQMVKNNSSHEIVSHSFSHVPFSSLTAQEALDELYLVKTWSENHDLNCNTFIFPRNLIAHEEYLKDIGITQYRASPNMLSNSLIEELLIFKKSESYPCKGDLEIPGGVFLNWKYGWRNLIPNKISLLKYKHMLLDAKENQKSAHFWFHPHNLISSSKTKYLFTQLCALIGKEVQEGNLNLKLFKNF